MSIEIRKACTRKEINQFFEFPLKLYKNNPYYVPPLLFDEKNTFDPKKNPALEFCEFCRFLALKEGKVVGRIATVINHSVNSFWKESHARFGWFDMIDDPAVSKALLDAAENWAKEKGMTALKGPLGFTDMDHEGMLIHGCDQLGTFATLYNYPYYPVHMEKWGYTKEVDWKEYLIDIPQELPERYTRMSALLSEKYQLHMAKIKSHKQLGKIYGRKLFRLWNETYNQLYGFSPLTEKQITYYIQMYLSIVRLDLISLILDEKEDIIGFGIAMPSFSKAMQKAKGHLFPFGFIHILRALRKNDRVDLYLMGVRPDYQQKGLISMIFADLVPKFIKNGYRVAETNPELETNGKIQQLWADFGPRHHKTRRVFIKTFSSEPES
jgi:GNAT superfamily N-acetyltransferase